MYTGSNKPENASSDFTWDLKAKPLWWSTFDDQYVKAWVYGTCEDWMSTYIQANSIPYDTQHFLVMPFCHPDAYPYPDPHGPFNGPYSIRRRCIGDRHVHNYLFDYAEQYYTNYQSIGKIGSFVFMEAHEGSMEVISQVDEDLSNFLQSPSIKAELNNTFLFVVADHGNHMSPFYLWTNNGILENRLPALFLLTPAWFAQRYPEMAQNLLVNQNRLVTAYDIHSTFMQLRALPEFNQSKNNNKILGGLFSEISETRLCGEAGIPEDMCMCK